MVYNEEQILIKDSQSSVSIKALISPMPLGKAGLFAMHLPTQGNATLCTSYDVSNVRPSSHFRLAFAHMALAFFLPCNLPGKCPFKFSSLVRVWITRVPKLYGRLYLL